MPKTVLQVLTEAKELLSDPKHWTKGEYARRADGSFSFYDSPLAVCFCSIGALRKVANHRPLASQAQWYLEEVVPNRDVAMFNDSPKTAHSDVLEKFSRAISICKDKGE